MDGASAPGKLCGLGNEQPTHTNGQEYLIPGAWSNRRDSQRVRCRSRIGTRQPARAYTPRRGSAGGARTYDQEVILIDVPRWPAHGTLWAHLVSDTSLDELHAFAERMGIPRRGFDLDHYDVPAERHAELVAAGAAEVDARELVTRLVASGLRVRGKDRDAARARAREATGRA